MLEQFRCRVHSRVPGEEARTNAWIDLLEGRQDLDPIASRHLHVQQDQVEGRTVMLPPIEGFGTTGGRHDSEASSLQTDTQQRPNRLFVIDNQDAGLVVAVNTFVAIVGIESSRLHRHEFPPFSVTKVNP